MLSAPMGTEGILQLQGELLGIIIIVIIIIIIFLCLPFTLLGSH